MSKFCTQCGNELNDDSKFCSKCGFSTDPTNNQNNYQNNQNQSNQQFTSNQENPQAMGPCSKCGQLVPFNSPTCNFCGQTNPTTPKEDHTVAIVLGYIFSIFGGWIGFIIALYLLTRDDPSAKKHGVIQLVISIVIGLIVLFMIVSWITFLNSYGYSGYY